MQSASKRRVPLELAPASPMAAAEECSLQNTHSCAGCTRVNSTWQMPLSPDEKDAATAPRADT